MSGDHTTLTALKTSVDIGIKVLPNNIALNCSVLYVYLRFLFILCDVVFAFLLKEALSKGRYN